ncbi:MAG: hypothetical protein JWL73_751 [Actinomycetia bacterium]|nr:hypothetical protein [Actinomycetes bacterium]
MTDDRVDDEIGDEPHGDERMYTGEPVEVDGQTVIPQQQNVGPGSEDGGGEFPDPDAPPTIPKNVVGAPLHPDR